MATSTLVRIVASLLLISLSCLPTAILAEVSRGERMPRPRAKPRADGRKAHIVYMGDLQAVEGISTSEQHSSMLAVAVADNALANQVKIYSYRRSFNGFAAYLLPHEAERLTGMPSVVSVFKSRIRNLATTRSWDFLGMTLNHTRRDPTAESNTIVAVLDGGIYIDARSFDDKGLGPPPAKWKGKCVKGTNFTGCNNKVIGARYYNLDPEEEEVYPSPIDTDGHGSHTASTAAGVAVNGASLYGIAKGIARGAVPGARIAVYKVCGYYGCPDANILAAFDDALADGVDVISVSIGGDPKPFFHDSIAIGAFHAVKKGILTACAAGNKGPFEATVENGAPWIITVAASSVDREFRTPVKLGNGLQFAGLTSINTFTPTVNMYPLTSGARAANKSADSSVNATACDDGSLDPAKVKGKIILCFGFADDIIYDLGGQGLVNANSEYDNDIAFTTLYPQLNVGSKAGWEILNYINSAKGKSVGVISKTITAKAKAPVKVASFSARGPQTVVPNILKPDITAPGLNILAAYSKIPSITEIEEDKRHYDFNIASGTSMSTPHVAGAAAYVKTLHPDWSAAAVRSALMTTATPIVVNGVQNPLESGSGLLNPKKAIHPGLVYDLTVDSYISYLCKEGYNSTTLSLLFGATSKVKCSDYPPAVGADGLNYPSMHLQLLEDEASYSAEFHRTVTLVGFGKPTYTANVKAPRGMSIQVIPNQLVFTKRHEKKNFKVVVKGQITDELTSVSGILEWRDGKHIVRSPIVISTPFVGVDG